MAKEKANPLTLAQLLDELKIGPNEWDVILVGDGSGTGWKSSCGWCCIVIDHYSNFHAKFWGGANSGTSQFAELWPYIHSMAWYAMEHGHARLNDLVKAGKPGKLRVHVITDNANLANQGNGKARRLAYSAVWKAIEGFELEGYQFTWHWVPRAKIMLNRFADTMAGISRVAFEKIDPPAGISAYDPTPDYPQFVSPPKKQDNRPEIS